MAELKDVVIGQNAIPALVITIVLLIAMPVALFIFWRRKHKEQTNISYLIAGAIGFLVTARVLEVGLHLICVLTDNPVSRFINGSTVAYVLYGAIAAGVFEECGRHIILKFILKKNRTRENSVMYGIGHGGMEVLAVVLPTLILYLVIAVLFSQGNLENALGSLNITEEVAAVALPTVRGAAAFDYGMMAANIVERLLSMLLHIGLTVIVYYGVVNAKKIYLPLAILLHMAADVFAALYQRGVVQLWLVEAWLALCTAVTAFIAVKLYKKMKSPSSTEDV